MNPTTPCSRTVMVDTYFDHGLPPPEAHALYEHIPACASCRERYNRQLVLESLLPESTGPKARLRTTLDIPASRTVLTSRRWWGPAAAVLAMAACALLFVRRPRDDAGFHARGDATSLAPRLDVYRLQGSAPSYVVDVVGRQDELAFTYTNPTGKKRVLVFAVDEHRHVYWYYPAWTRADETVTSIPIVTTREPVELKEGVTHDFDTSRVRIYGVFTDEAMTTREVEARLAKAPPLTTKLDWPNTLETSTELEVR